MKRIFAFAALIALILIFDQQTKRFARLHLAVKPPRHYGILTLLYDENRGAFLSMGSSLSPEIRTVLFEIVVAVGLVAAAFLLFKTGGIALALIIAGGIGNLIERLRFGGRVTDFLYLAVGPLHTGVFNVADMAITFGAIWLFISWCRPSRRADSPSPPSR